MQHTGPFDVDLQIHTTASDGTCTPAQVVELAARQGLRALAVTDHDSILGLAEAMGAARGGVNQLDVNDLWRSWTENYAELVRSSTKATKDYSSTELAQIYGVTAPIRNE